MTRDENKYPSSDQFKPERFLHDDGSLTNDTMALAFGWGRRDMVSIYACFFTVLKVTGQSATALEKESML
jgi:hypothetical protein